MVPKTNPNTQRTSRENSFQLPPKRKCDPEKKRVQAAVIIQRAYRNYRKRKQLALIRKDNRKRCKDRSPQKKLKSESFFMEIMNKLTQPKVDPPLTKKYVKSTRFIEIFLPQYPYQISSMNLQTYLIW